MRPSVKAFVILLAIVGFWLGVDQARRHLKSTFLGERVIALSADRTRREVAKLKDHPWTGDYYAGDGLGSNTELLIGEKQGFVLTQSGCVYLDRNVGFVSEENGSLKLSYTFQADRSSPRELIRVPWGDRHYLVPREAMKSFCDAVNRGREPRNGVHGDFLLRKGDENIRANGFPDVPREYRALLLKHRIDGTVIEVDGVTNRPSDDEIGFTDTQVTIDAGAADGIRPHQILYVVEKNLQDATFEVTSVSSNRCVGTITQNGMNRSPAEIGWRVSTKPWSLF